MTRYVHVNQGFSAIGSSRIIQVPTSPVTQIVLSTGYLAMQVFNVGPSAIAWGDTSITMSTGGLLFYSMGKSFGLEGDSLNDDFSFYVIADSISGTVVVNEFR